MKAIDKSDLNGAQLPCYFSLFSFKLFPILDCCGCHINAVFQFHRSLKYLTKIVFHLIVNVFFLKQFPKSENYPFSVNCIISLE